MKTYILVMLLVGLMLSYFGLFAAVTWLKKAEYQFLFILLGIALVLLFGFAIIFHSLQLH